MTFIYIEIFYFKNKVSEYFFHQSCCFIFFTVMFFLELWVWGNDSSASWQTLAAGIYLKEGQTLAEGGAEVSAS